MHLPPTSALVARAMFCLGLGLAAITVPATLVAAETPAPLDTQEQAFVAKATADNTLQITLAQIAGSRSRSHAVRALARRIIEDHNALNAKLSAFSVARKARGNTHGVPVPDMNADKGQLQQLDGEALDRAYAGMVEHAHEQIMPAWESIAKTSRNAALRKIAREGLPMLREHLEAARAINRP